MKGGYGTDSMLGGTGDDGIEGGPDDDIILGNSGSDIIIGLDGNDFLSHSETQNSASDGAKDKIYCGEGYDQVWLNKVTDNDTQYDCEKVNENSEMASTDTDNHGVRDLQDNCPEHPNNSQIDRDGDGLDEECDSD